VTPQSVPETANPGAPHLASEMWVATELPRTPEARRLFWLIRREFWENRSLYIAPLAVAALIVLGFLYSAIRIPADNVFLTTTTVVNGTVTRAQHGIDPIQIYDLAATLIMTSTFFVAIFYCLDALYSERRDRSILFWKSLPLSDLTTVLSKATIPLILLPLLTWVITVVTQTLMLLINLAVFHARGMDTTALHTNLPLAQNSLLLLYHLVAIDALWYAPIWAWLLLISAWARRTPLLWAILPPFALTILEAITLHTSYVSRFLTYRLHGPAGMDFHTLHGPEGVGVMSMSPHFQITPAQFLATPGLWIGLALAAIFLAAAIQLRRYRNPL